MKNNIKLAVFVFFISLFISGCDFSIINRNLQGDTCTRTVLQTNILGTPIDEDIVGVYERVIQSTVTVFTFDDAYEGISSGSGVVVSEYLDYAYIYTNTHVVSGGSKFEVAFSNRFRAAATLIESDPSEDVAILRISKSDNYTVATLGSSSILKVGQSVFALGSPLGFDYANTLTHGVISGLNVRVDTDNDKNGTKTTMYMIQIDATLNPGNSGGPLFSAGGELIGINTLKVTTSDNGDAVESFNFSIAIDHFKNVADSLLTSGSYSRPRLGIVVIDVSSMSLNEREENNINVSFGLFVDSVSLIGPSAGIIEENMIITKINDVNVSSMNQFSVELYRYKVGDCIDVTVTDKNGGNETVKSIVLGS